MSSASLIVSGLWFVVGGLISLVASECNAAWTAKWTSHAVRKRSHRPAWWFGAAFLALGVTLTALGIVGG